MPARSQKQAATPAIDCATRKNILANFVEMTENVTVDIHLLMPQYVVR